MGVKYTYHKSIAIVLRALASTKIRIDAHPDEVLMIPSRDANRSIKAHVYYPTNKDEKPGPVLINFCGSGFVLRMFGTDDEYCRHVAKNTEHTVIDVQYRLAPEHPFPAAFNDAQDVVTWVRAQPQFDLEHVSLSGFSAGANIALAVSSSSPRFNTRGNENVFRTVMSFYGPTDMALPTPEKPQADNTNFIIRKIFPPFSHLCHKCLSMGKVDPADPRISPKFADPSDFPDNVIFITAAQDPFAIEAENLAEAIRAVEGKTVACERMDECAHGWDKEAIRGTSQCQAKDAAYALAVGVLNRGGAEAAFGGESKVDA
ncbi:hypothetical protein N7492_002534 [Penicillium capsulatum]|uniref:Alpha/beta hydrolase fold-3 domain-containing protein n=1 Tax=Penicillium capsulatum TaxID=69766 RepID=A0A9W9II11_9EURO|nr:hypothetical protein N7492_002534 [Penicillium capsulatum]KAJ6122862.1 hypothetical protein N7512_005327 [Penicillium capsulatum]